MKASTVQLITMLGPLLEYTSGEVSADAIVLVLLEAVGKGNEFDKICVISLHRSRQGDSK